MVLTTDQIDVNASGSLGVNGSATTSATIRNLNRSTTQSELTGGEILSADTLASTCTATGPGWVSPQQANEGQRPRSWLPNP